METNIKPERIVQIATPSMGEDEWLAVREPIEAGWLTQGPKVAAFEHEFSELHQVPHALATTSCTTALHLGLAAMGIGPGDEVIVPSFTWIATANAVLYCGATPVICDVDPATFNIDPISVSHKLTDRTKAVMAVHLFGRCADMDALRAIIPEKIKIVEDAACAAGASYNGVSAGALGDAAAFSFHPRKSVTCGEGGMLTFSDDEFAARARILRNHGASISEEQRHRGPQPWLLPEFEELGYNYRMTDVQAAIGLVQLKKLTGFIAERNNRANWYKEALSELDWLQTPQACPKGTHSWQAYVTTVDPKQAPISRNELMARLHLRGVATRPGTHAIHMLGYYANRFGFCPADFPGSRACVENTMAIPLHNCMTDDDYEYVVAMIKEAAHV